MAGWRDFQKDFEKLKIHGEEEKLHPYCNALLLQFKEPKVYDLSIPSPYNIYSLVNLGLRVLTGEKIDIKNVNCSSTSHDNLKGMIQFDDLNNIFKDYSLSKNLYLSLFEPRDEYSKLAEYMNCYNSLFRTEWFMGKGNWYEIRIGKIEELEKEVLKTLSNKQIEKIKLLGDAFQPYIGLTNSSFTIE